MKVLHLLASGDTGGIETLCRDYGMFSKLDNTFLFIWNAGCIAEEMKKNNNKVIELNANKKNVLGTLIKILHICKSKKIDAVVVHHDSPIAHLYLMIIKRIYKHIATFAYAHENAEDMKGGSGDSRGLLLRRLVIKKSLKKSDQVIAISKSVKKSLVNYFNIKEDKISIIYNGVNIDKFCNINKKKSEKLQIIYVGRLIKQKGVQNIIKVLSKLPNDFDYKFKIIGKGNYRAELESEIQKYRLDDKVEFYGDRRDVPELLASSDVFIHLPEWEEGFGITIVEAMASGLICICKNSGAIPEIIDNSVNGYLVDSSNYAEICEIIQDISRNIDSEVCKNIRLNAIEKAKFFSINAYVEKMDNLIKTVTLKIKDYN